MYNPTPWQFLLDLFAKKRIADAVKSGDEKQIAEINRLYENLKENEVVFSKPEFVKKAIAEKSYWKVTFECPGRGFASPGITFRTYPLSAMIGSKASILTGNPSLVKTPGFYVNKETGSFHLIVMENQDTDQDPITQTGYYFEREYVEFEKYPDFDETVSADGVIAISYPHVAGKIYVNYIKPEPVKEFVEEQIKEELNEQTFTDSQNEGVEGEAEISDQSNSEDQSQQNPVEEKQQEVAQKYKQKNNRR